MRHLTEAEIAALTPAARAAYKRALYLNKYQPKRKSYYERISETDMELKTEHEKIGGLTTYCHEQHLDEFIANSKHNKIQPFELYEAPPRFLPSGSLLFVFQTGEAHRLRMIARHVGWVKVNGWLENKDSSEKEEFCRRLAQKLEEFYLKNDIRPHCNGDKLVKFCSQQDGVRGIFLFKDVNEVEYSNPNVLFKKGDFQKVFGGSQPYAQGFPYRYLTPEETNHLLDELKKTST